jgi:AcrR family transcriptional regulator
MATTPRASRRSTEEVRSLILDAAAEQFTTHGYAQTTMRSIASAAGISLSVLHRQFPGKDDLFSTTLLAPFLASINEFAAAWSEQIESPWDDERLMREFVRDLYNNTTRHRETLAALVSADEVSQPELLDQVRAGLEAAFTELGLISEHEAAVRGWSPETIALLGRLAVSMIIGTVLLQPLLTDTLRAEDDIFVETATKLLLYGVALTPGS